MGSADLTKMFGKKNKPFFVAEISSNHNGNFNYAKKLIAEAKKYGANAVKLQTYTPSSMTVNSVGEFHCNDSGYEGSHFMKNAIDSIVSNISAQCLSTDRCGKRVRKEEIVFQYSVPSAFKCAVNGSYSY